MKLQALLPDRTLRLKAADALLAIVTKKSREVCEKDMNDLATRLICACKVMGTSTDQEDYRYCKRLVQVLCELSINHPGVLIEYPETAHELTSLMVSLAAYPCVRIPAMTLSFWGGLVEAQRNAKVPKSGPKNSLILMSEQYQAAFVHAWAPKMVHRRMSELDEMDFIDEEEFSQEHSTSQGRFLDILRKLAAELPREVLLQVGGMWQDALLGKGALQTQAHGGTSVSISVLEGLHRVLERTVESIPPQYLGEGEAEQSAEDLEIRGKVNAACEEIIRTLFESASDPNFELRVLVIKAIGFFSIYFQQAEAETLYFIVHKLLTLYSSYGDPEGMRLARRAISTVLLKIGGVCAHKLAPHMEGLVTLVQGIAQQVPGEETSQLTELLFVISTGLESAQQRKMFMQYILSGVCELWSKQRVADLHTGVLKSCIGATTGTEDAVLEDRRAVTLTALNTLSSLLRRVAQAEGTEDEARPYAEALAMYVPNFMPNLLVLTQAIHAMWEPSVKSAVVPRWHGVYMAVELKGALDPNWKASPLDCGDPKVSHHFSKTHRAYASLGSM